MNVHKNVHMNIDINVHTSVHINVHMNYHINPHQNVHINVLFIQMNILYEHLEKRKDGNIDEQFFLPIYLV